MHVEACMLDQEVRMGAGKGGLKLQCQSIRLIQNLTRRRVPPKLPPSTGCPAGMHGKKSDSKLVAASLDLEFPE